VTYIIASEGRKYIESRGIRPGRMLADEEPVPSGTVHAFDTSTQMPACGKTGVMLHQFDTVWPGGMGLDRCEECVSRTGT
jgi:hypothetical protein